MRKADESFSPAAAPRESYAFPLDAFISRERFERVKKFAATRESPCLVMDLDVVAENFSVLGRLLPFAEVFYEVSANPMREVLELLRDLGAGFSVASRYELEQVLGIGVSPGKIAYGNTIKKRKDIGYAYASGVRLFATDSPADVNSISDMAPGSMVTFRLLVEGRGADLPVSRKFGAHPDLVRQLIKLAVRLGLVPYGISFHPGSQQRDIGQWSTSLTTVGQLFRTAREEIHVDLKMAGMGGGLPAAYLEPADPVASYAEDIERFIGNSFGADIPERIVVEPGRFLVGGAGIIVAEIVNIAKKSVRDRYPWVFLDVGKFGGLIETQDEAIKYPIFFEGEGEALEVIIAGPTCDSMDVLYEKWSYAMPSSAKIGQRAYILTAGAYTSSYSSICFNGFPPLRSYILE
jgi:ornithine decarboxylase